MDERNQKMTISQAQRDALYEKGLGLVAGVDAALWSAIDAENWAKASQIALRASDFLRVANEGLGWGSIRQETITLSAPADVVVRCLDSLLPEIDGRLRLDLEGQVEAIRPHVPEGASDSELEIDPDQQRFLVREILTRLTELDGLSRCLRAEEWSDLRAYAEEFSDLLRFMAEDLQWRPRRSGNLRPIAPPDVVQRSIKYLMTSVNEARRVSETHAREAQEEAQEFQEIEDRLSELLDGEKGHRGG
ncbi:MAG: hypothetical protein ACTHNP_02230 [Solirubrobacterales bacterium]